MSSYLGVSALDFATLGLVLCQRRMNGLGTSIQGTQTKATNRMFDCRDSWVAWSYNGMLSVDPALRGILIMVLMIDGALSVLPVQS